MPTSVSRNSRGSARLAALVRDSRFQWSPLDLQVSHTNTMQKALLALFALYEAAEAFAPSPMLRPASAALRTAAPAMVMDTSVVEQMTNTMAGVVAVDGGAMQTTQANARE